MFASLVPEFKSQTLYRYAVCVCVRACMHVCVCNCGLPDFLLIWMREIAFLVIYDSFTTSETRIDLLKHGCWSQFRPRSTH